MHESPFGTGGNLVIKDGELNTSFNLGLVHVELNEDAGVASGLAALIRGELGKVGKNRALVELIGLFAVADLGGAGKGPLGVGRENSVVTSTRNLKLHATGNCKAAVTRGEGLDQRKTTLSVVLRH